MFPQTRKSLLLLVLLATILEKESVPRKLKFQIQMKATKQRKKREREGTLYIDLILNKSWSLLWPTRRFFPKEGCEVLFDLSSRQRNRELHFLLLLRVSIITCDPRGFVTSSSPRPQIPRPSFCFFASSVSQS